LSRTTRLLSLLQILRGRRQPVTSAFLAGELGISERTLYRDVAELKAQGAPIYGEAGVGYVLRPGLFLPPLMLSEDETEAVVLGLRYAEQRGDAILAKAAREALVKIATVLSPAARETAQNPIALPGPPGWGFPANAVDLAALRIAIRVQAKLHIDYKDAAGQESERVIWPIALGFLNEARVLVAWCEARQAYRSFRTDRIATARQSAERYVGRRALLLEAWRAQQERTETDAFTPDKN